MSDKAILELNGERYEFPLVVGTENEVAIDIKTGNKIVSIDEKYVVIDIGFKSEGIIAVNEFSNKSLENMAPGDEVEVFLDRVEDKEGQLILSRRKADILLAVIESNVFMLSP